jgi:predicted Rossmann-fold nucleotide-binding protein
MPGGIGTLDELFEALTLIQTKMILYFPVVLFGKEYHKELYEHIQLMADKESISREDMELLFITDSVEDMVVHLKVHAVKQFVLIKKPMKKRWWFGETKPINQTLNNES